MSVPVLGITMGVGKDQAARIARLIAIDLSEAELNALGRHLERVLADLETLDEVDTEGIEPLHQPHGQSTTFRADSPADSLPVEQALANAPEREGDLFKVPRIIEPAG